MEQHQEMDTMKLLAVEVLHQFQVQVQVLFFLWLAVQEVVHLLRDVRPTTGEMESELKSGACWIEPLDHSRIAEVPA